MEEHSDGGNLKIAINNNPPVLVPSAAFVVNGYTDTLDLSASSADWNPLSGQPVFTSPTESSDIDSRWRTTQVDLRGFSMHPGDAFRLIWEVGTDSCTGYDGWYIDNVRVAVCNTAPTKAALSQASTGDVQLRKSVKVVQVTADAIDRTWAYIAWTQALPWFLQDKGNRYILSYRQRISPASATAAAAWKTWRTFSTEMRATFANVTDLVPDTTYQVRIVPATATLTECGISTSSGKTAIKGLKSFAVFATKK
jgi:hypothetical protein